jgi:hypothetical protein
VRRTSVLAVVELVAGAEEAVVEVVAAVDLVDVFVAGVAPEGVVTPAAGDRVVACRTTKSEWSSGANPGAPLGLLRRGGGRYGPVRIGVV